MGLIHKFTRAQKGLSFKLLDIIHSCNLLVNSMPTFYTGTLAENIPTDTINTPRKNILFNKGKNNKYSFNYIFLTNQLETAITYAKQSSDITKGKEIIIIETHLIPSSTNSPGNGHPILKPDEHIFVDYVLTKTGWFGGNDFNRVKPQAYINEIKSPNK
jgi:hypothetical protein